MPRQALIYVYAEDGDEGRRIRDLLQSVGLEARCFADDRSFFREYTDERAGCLVLDAPKPGLPRLQLQRDVVDQAILLPIVVVTRFPDVPTAVEAIKGGAMDYLERPFDDQTLLERVQAAVACNAGQLRCAADHAAIEARLQTLTRREREILEYVIAGMPSRKIADCLKLSAKTVEVHRSHLMHKVQAQGVADLVRMVLSVRENGQSFPTGDDGELAN